MTPIVEVRRRTALLGGLGVMALTLATYIATGPSLVIAWDESYTLERLEQVRGWFAALADPASARAGIEAELRRRPRGPFGGPLTPRIDSRPDLFRADAVDWYWPFAREEPDGHPPFYALVALVGDVLAPGLPALPRARLGTMLAVSLAAGAIFAFLARRRGIGAGLVGAGAWVLHPHVFALGHYATYDALLAALWIGVILAFARAVEPVEPDDPPDTPPRRRPRWAWVLVCGVLLGWAAGTKLTGWLLPIPLIAWSAIFSDRRGFLTIAVGLVVAALTLFVFTPPFWPDPVAGVSRFFASNLNRQHTIPIQVMFLGEIYNTPRQSLPPYNTLLLTVMVTPVGFLALGLVGAWQSARRFRVERLGMLVLVNWLFLLTLRAMPGAPGHDGVRQFLPAFGCLALLAGLGAAVAIDRLGRLARPLLAAAMAEGALSVVLMLPVPLSYFSPIVGGLPGAAALGMEPTYYWDAVSDDALAAIDARTPENRSVAFVGNPISYRYTRAGRLKAEVYPFTRKRLGLYVVQNRPGSFGGMQPAIEQLGSDQKYVVASKFGVPLIWAFPAEAVDPLLPGVPGRWSP